MSRSDSAGTLTAGLELIETLRGDASAVMDFRAIPETGAAKKMLASGPIRLRYRGALPNLLDKLKRLNNEGFAVYYALNLSDGKGTKCANFRKVLALPLDLDTAPLPKKWFRGLEPHLIIETSPGKHQCIFVIEPTNDFAATKHMVQRLARAYGGDPSVCDVPRVLRMPGFKHQKGNPFVSRIISSRQFEAPYTMVELDKALPRLPRNESAPSDEPPEGFDTIGLEDVELMLKDADPAQVVPGNTEWEEVAMALHTLSNNDHDVKEFFLDWCQEDPSYAGQEHRDTNEFRWDSFTADKPGGRGAGTLRRRLLDNGISAENLKVIFGRATPEDDFDVDPALKWDFESVEDCRKNARVYKTNSGVQYQLASEVEPEPINWLWPNRIARGKLNFLAGPPDQGKSQITCDLIARVTTGSAWPDESGKPAPGSVIVLAAEDDAGDTIVPRLKAAGAEVSKVMIVQMMVKPLKARPERMFNLANDLPGLAELIRTCNDVALVVIDPINSYMGAGGRNGTDTFKASEVRSVLSPLGNLAERHDVAVLFLSHLTKNSGGNAPLARMLDSQAFTAIARCGWFVAPEMQDRKETARKFFVKGKSNIGAPVPGLTYEIEETTVTTAAGLVLKVPRIKWTGETDMSAGQVFRQMDNGGEQEKGSALEAAITFVEDELASGPKPSDKLKDRAEERGHSWRTVRRAAFEGIGVRSERSGFGKGSAYVWSLPGPDIDFG
ncbi:MULTISPECIES: AAA family ATPase [Bradyrhizobium]|uniref:AAA family ATPase n=1 Tax=Bradyrhizobium TaxID=374 RepID=UPI00155EFEEB|nr:MULTISPECIES: AAA family ATPase [Bradyrhizobium]UUO27710.1 hypothetical protein DCG74_10725 [Bradyrhizobium sp. WBAH42]